jgi:indoleacetamide hydrolase
MKIDSLSLRTIVSKIRTRELKCVQVAEAFIENIEKKSNHNAVIYFNKNDVINEAKKLDKEADAGKFRGRLHGGPIAVKDNIHMKGVPNTAGCPGLKNFIPNKDAPVIEALRKQGPLFIAKTNMHELAFGVTSNNAFYGPCRNAQAFDYSAGGSSGGTGGAIGCKMAPVGLGTDTGGSVRIPSSVNGLFGLRPTIGRYSNVGVTPLSVTRDTIGPMSYHIDDLIILDEIITGQEYKENSLPKSLKGLRFGISKDFYEDSHPDVEMAFKNAKKYLKSEGVELVDVDTSQIRKINSEFGLRLVLYETRINLIDYLRDHKVGLSLQELAKTIASPDVKKIFYESVFEEGASSVKEAEYNLMMKKKRPALISAYKDVFNNNKISALLFPTLRCLPVRISEINEPHTLESFITNTDINSNAGIPGLTIPFSRNKSGLPIGIEIDGPWNSDHFLLKVGSLIKLEN